MASLNSLALGIVSACILSGVASAETLKACEQSVEYNIDPPAADVPATARAFSGAWVGKMDTGLCVALIVRSVRADGTAQITYVNGSMGGQYSIKAGKRNFAARIEGNKLVTSGQTATTEYVLRAPTEVAMTFTHNQFGRNQGVLRRQ